MVEEFTDEFMWYIRRFATLGSEDNLFPKECRVCGKTFGNFSQYCRKTLPKGKGFEEFRSRSGDRHFTMLYRHCVCGNTLALIITEETLPGLDSFWEMVQGRAQGSDCTVEEVLADFMDQLDQFVELTQGPY
jgi:hypothetical protein